MRFLSLKQTEKSSLSRENPVTEAKEGRNRKRLSIAHRVQRHENSSGIRVIKKPLVLANKKIFVALVKEIQDITTIGRQ